MKKISVDEFIEKLKKAKENGQWTNKTTYQETGHDTSGT